MINVRQVSFSYGYEPVLQDVSFLVPNGKKVGLVGANGAGKTTLLKLLTREEEPSAGTIEISGVMSYVPQEVRHDADFATATNWRTYVDPHHKVSDQRLYPVLTGLELDWTKLGSNLNEYSGGQKTKLALARAFLRQPDILLLDEPTNFLDTAGKKWVMHFLAQYKKTVVVVSHDLKLLDHHISQVLYINPQTHTVDVYTGNYSKFVATKAQMEAHLVRQIRNEQQHIKQLEKSVERLRQYKSDRGVRQRIVLQRRVQRIKDALPPAPPSLRQITMHFPPPAPLGEVAITALHLAKSFGTHSVLSEVNLEIRRGERVALVGPNGVGKSTLIKILTGELVADAGIVRRNPQLSVGYYSQENQTGDDTLTLEQIVANTDRLPSQSIYPFLARFLFTRDRLHQRVGTLSGGEKTRLSIGLLMLYAHNLLILDEPTTYLDVLSQRVILEALKDYPGALLLVSHTPEFVSELKPDKVLLLPQNRTRTWSAELLDEVSVIQEGSSVAG